MTHATEKLLSGRKPVWVCECDLDSCTKVWEARTKYDIVDNGTGYVRVTGDVDGDGFIVGADIGIREDNTNTTDTVVTFDKNLVRYSEDMDSAQWQHNPPITHTLDSSTLPDGVDETWTISDDGLGVAEEGIRQTLQPVLEDNEQYMLSVYALEGTATKFTIGVYDVTGAAWRCKVEFIWNAGVLSVSSEIVGTGSVTAVGGGIYRANALTPAAVVVAANSHNLQIFPTDISAPTAGATVVAGTSLHKGTAVIEYQRTQARNGTQTNITLTTGGLTLDAEIGEDCFLATVGALCRATGAAGSACYDTLTTCQYTSDYVKTVTTYRFCTDNADMPPDAGAIPSLRSVDIAATQITRGQGLGMRGGVSLAFEDHPHHDRGVDPYVATRSYTPMDTGTYWSKLRRRNKYYQGRVCRVKSGYISDSGLDLTNDFITRTYLLEKIEGPDANGQVRVTAKDPIKLADNKRAQSPPATTGILTAGIDAAVATIAITNADGTTSSPDPTAEYTAIGDGTIRIGSEIITYTGTTGTTFTGCTRGQHGTTAAIHATADVVQGCIAYSDATIDDVVYEQLVTYGNVPAAYITLADWTADTEDWLASNKVTSVISEPTGVSDILSELSEQYMFDLWWDDTASQIRLKVLQPHSGALDAITDDANIGEGSIGVSDNPEGRYSEVWVYWGVRDWSEPLDEPRNYDNLTVYDDQAAEGVNQYDDVRIKKVFSRWFSAAGDASRLGARTLNAHRDNPRTFAMTLDFKDYDYGPGDVFTLTSDVVVGETGAAEATDLYVLSSKEAEGGTIVKIMATEERFDGRYGRIAPNGMDDYDAASAANLARYAWVAEDDEPQLNGDGAYRVV